MVALKSKTRKATEIQSAAIFRCTDKVTGKCLGYAVKSDTTSDTYYVTYDYSAHHYCCTCPARVESCKHVRAVLEVVSERKQYQQVAVPQAATLATYDVQAAAVQVVREEEEGHLDSFYSERGAEITTKKIAYRIEARDGQYFPQHQYPGEAWDCYWTGRALLHFKSAYEARQHLNTYYGAHDVEVVGEAVPMVKEHVTCDFCGRNHNSSTCYL